jgi:excisionase family DNA binding protein
MERSGEMLTITQAAQRLGISRPQVRRLIDRGELTAFASVLDRRAVFIRARDVGALQDRSLVALSGNESRRQVVAA